MTAITTRNQNTELVAANGASIAEQAAIVGDLSKLTAEQRMAYYRQVCESMGLNPLTQPFQYIELNRKLTLYASRSATDQLRKINRVSVSIASREQIGDVYVVTARATTPDGRCDESTGAVPLATLKGESLANALMKAETKAKRRVTLSICGLGWLDESEVGSISDAKQAHIDYETGEIVQPVPVARIASKPAQSPANRTARWIEAARKLAQIAQKVGLEYFESDFDTMDQEDLADYGKTMRAAIVGRMEFLSSDAENFTFPEGWETLKVDELDALATELVESIAVASGAAVEEAEVVQGEII